MEEIKHYKSVTYLSMIFLMVCLFFYGDMTLYYLTDLFILLLMAVRALKINSKKRLKTALVMAYVFLFPIQMTFIENYIGGESTNSAPHYIYKFIGIALILVPFAIERSITIKKYTEFYFPSVLEINTISFTQLMNVAKRIDERGKTLKRLSSSVTLENIEEIVTDLPRHSSTRYINNGSLTDAYFEKAYENLDDPNVYIVISNTGSAASEIISVFTKKQYNHASLAFDSQLETIISYNGGEKVYPPGLNHEMIEFFNKKEGASIMVYKVSANRDQKQSMIEKIREINAEGSAYNIMGLALKYSHKPNIMFCSQFVYSMLKLVGLEYFDKKDGDVKPTDLVELDYHRKLEFCYEMLLNED